jgi:hypothetical protein
MSLVPSGPNGSHDILNLMKRPPTKPSAVTITTMTFQPKVDGLYVHPKIGHSDLEN